MMNLEFKKVTAEDCHKMLPFYGMRNNRTCDSVFLESFIWKEFYQVSYAIWENKALLWLMEYEGEYFSAMPLCAERDLKDAFLTLEQYFNHVLQVPLVIHLADEDAVRCLDLSGDAYWIEEQEDAKDYLYEGTALRTLSGRKLHKKKNRLNTFMRQYENRFMYQTLTCAHKTEMWNFLDEWRAGKGEEGGEHLEYEIRGIQDILKHCSSLPVRMGGIFIDGKLKAFSIGSKNELENMAVIHIEKADVSIPGLYQAINQLFLLNEFPDVKWVNREDDLGLEGLRKAKMSYCPADFAKKYLVKQKRYGNDR